MFPSRKAAQCREGERCRCHPIPLKQQLTLRLDADVIAWFKDHAPKGQGYQTNINRALREHVQRRVRKAG
jgi:uncharacterized protein (DUF4415 family)